VTRAIGACRGNFWMIFMRYDFFPDDEPTMVAWSMNFAKRLQQQPGHFEVPVKTVEAFVDLQQQFVRAYELATTPQTRTGPGVANKNEKRRAMEHLARMIAVMLRGTTALSDVDRLALGLNVPKARVRHVRPPGNSPVVKVLGIQGKRVMISLSDSDRKTRRARPDEATGATLFYHVGESPPLNRDDWRYLICSTKTRLTIDFDQTLPTGTRVWISGWWKNRRDEAGPSSRPVSVCVGEGICSTRTTATKGSAMVVATTSKLRFDDNASATVNEVSGVVNDVMTIVNDVMTIVNDARTVA